ncbi:MAG: hypothetical protein KatS3mg110_3258 [Pirellulaceae bacterium]|nr:MAG: hypothetical protein KatS3mg110_3258 [Pirellulaceae bacterium]
MIGRSRLSQPSLSLFPFLAVLICTMGALVMLLVLVVEQAKLSSRQNEQDSQLAAELEQVRFAVEDQTWRRDVLEQQRQELLRQLADQRAHLAHLEAHIRELEEELERVRIEVEQWQKLAHNQHLDTESLASRQRELEAAVAEAREALEEARRRAAGRQPTFAIIPYPGPNGTTRRPIYIECTKDAVILRPENIVLKAEDFDDPLGAGNPLDAALRTAARYYRQLAPDGSEQPYPLLVVRPDGVLAYAAARQAMVSWEEEFGYELVSAELILEYPPPDPHLVKLLEQAVQEARQRQWALRRAMPARSRAAGFVVSARRGGVVPIDGLPLGTAQRPPKDRPNPGATREPATPPAPSPTATQPAQNTQSFAGGVPGGPHSFGSLAKTRGSDWAVEKRATGATAYRRPVRVVCQKEALILMPDPGSTTAPEPIPFGDDPTAAVDRFVEALRRRVRQWGTPPLGGYWQPQLIIDVAPDAQARYELLDILLDDSGLELKRTTP